MSYAIENIGKMLKDARKRKDLSQRALSEQSGVRQYQISKIENGAVDLRISSLIELARALDLDLKLVPRKAIPAVDSIVRSTTPTVTATPAGKELQKTLDAVRKLRIAYPDISELTNLQKNIQGITNLQGIGLELEKLREIARPIREIQKLNEASKKNLEAVKIPANHLQALKRAINSAQILRNQIAHNSPRTPTLPKPAYSLDEDDDG